MEIKQMIQESIDVKEQMLDMDEDINKAAHKIIDSMADGNKLLIAGNGGSAADAQHFAAELVGRFKLERKALPAIALTTDTSIITAWSNDHGFDTLFSRQIEALGNKGDLLFVLSTSGNSQNIINAIDEAKQKGIYTIALLGKDGGKIKDLVDFSIIIKSNNTPRVQECHIMIIHIICEVLENEMFGKHKSIQGGDT